MTVGFIVREGFASLRRVAGSSAIGVFVIGIALTIVGALGFVALGYHSELVSARSEVTAEVFLAENVDEARGQAIAGEITAFEGVRSARLRNRSEIASIFGGDTSTAANGIVLPLSVQVVLSESEKNVPAMDALGSRVRKIVGVEEVAFPNELLAAVEKRSELLKQIVLYLGIALLLAIAGIVAIVSHISVVTRQSVIRTMSLLGAERRWIAAPFVVQGACVGLLGGILAAGLLLGGTYALNALPLLHENNPAVLALFPVAGTLLGAVGSGIASSRHLGS